MSKRPNLAKPEPRGVFTAENAETAEKNKRKNLCVLCVCLYPCPIQFGRNMPYFNQTVWPMTAVPEPVVAELDMGRFIRRDTIDPRKLDWPEIVSVSERDIEGLPPNRLGIGKQAVIAYAQCTPNCWAGLDDRQARGLAEDLGLDVVGTIGVLLRAKRSDLISVIRPVLDALQREGFRMGDDLYRETLQLANEA